MVTADWDEQGAPGGSFSLGALGWEPVRSDDPADVPEVAAARAHGYLPAPEAPLWCFLPALWPAGHRAWVRDTRVRHLTRQYDARPPERLPWTAADHAEVEQSTNALLAELGLPARPMGRIWLLRAPAPYGLASELVDELWDGWLASGGPATATPELVDHVRARFRAVF